MDKDDDIERQAEYVAWIVPAIVVVLAIAMAGYAYADDFRASKAVIMGKPVFITNQPCVLTEYKDTHPWVAYVVHVESGLHLEGCWRFGTGIKTDLILIQWNKGDVSELLADEFLTPDSQGQAAITKKPALKAEGDPL